MPQTDKLQEFSYVFFATINFDKILNVCSTGQIENEFMDSKLIVGVENELNFIGCGSKLSYGHKRMDRTREVAVRKKNECLKAIALD